MSFQPPVDPLGAGPQRREVGARRPARRTAGTRPARRAATDRTNRSRCSSVPCSRIVGSAQAAITMSGLVTSGAARAPRRSRPGSRRRRRGRPGPASAGSGSRSRRGPARRSSGGRRSAATVSRISARIGSSRPSRSTVDPAAYAGSRLRGEPLGRSVAVAEQAAQHERAPQVEVGVVLVGEADPAEHLDAALGDLDGTVEARPRRPRRPRRPTARRLVEAPRRRRPRRPRSPTRTSPASRRTGA